MAERQGQGHDEVCANASGHVCMCACRGRFHGVAASSTGRGGRLSRMAEVSVQGRTDVAPQHPGGKAATAAQRARNPVVVGRDEHGVVDGTRAAELRDQQTARIRASQAPTVQDVSPGARPGARVDQEEAYRRMHGDAAGDRKFGPRRTRAEDVTVSAVQVNRREVPADLTAVSEDDLAEMLGTHPEQAERVGDEFDRRDRERRYGELIASIPPTAAGLEALDEDRVMNLYAQVTATDTPDAVATARLEVELDRRSEAERTARQQLTAFVQRDPAGLDVGELDIMARHAATLGDVAALDRVYAEYDRREQERRAASRAEQARAGAAPSDWLDNPADAEWPTQWRDEETEQDRRLSELLEQGWDWIEAYAEAHGAEADAMRRQEAGQVAGAGQGVTVERALRRQYDEWVSLRYLEAETATRGHVLNAQARARGVDPVSLFSGPMHVARANASEELLRWWAAGNTRLTYADFKAQVIGGTGSRQQRELAGQRGNGRDFG